MFGPFYFVRMRILVTLFSLLILNGLFAQRPEIYCKHFISGYPFGTPATNDLIIRDLYALSSNDKTKFADWVAYFLDSEVLIGDFKAHRNWHADPWLSEDETLEPYPNDDYKNAHATIKTDRGHFAPLGSFKGSPKAAQTNFLSNISPQYSDLNQGPWHNLELKTRSWIKRGNTAFIITGPLYERAMPQLPNADEPHQVPSGYWKIIFSEKNNQRLVLGFIFDQETPRDFDFSKGLVSINEIENRSGLDFFWLLNQEEEEELEQGLNREFLKEFAQKR